MRKLITNCPQIKTSFCSKVRRKRWMFKCFEKLMQTLEPEFLQRVCKNTPLTRKAVLFASILRSEFNFQFSCERFEEFTVLYFRAPYDWQAPGTFRNLLTNRPMPARAPDDARPGTGLCLELHTVRSDLFLQKYILHLHRYFALEDQ